MGFQRGSVARAVLRIGHSGRLGRRPRDRFHDLRFRRRRARADADRRRDARRARPARRAGPRRRPRRAAGAAPAVRALETRIQRVDGLARRLVHPAARLAQQRRDAAALAGRLARAYRSRLAARRRGCRRPRPAPGVAAAAAAAAVRAPGARCATRLRRAAATRLERSGARIAALAQSLAHLNPHAVLDRGYAIVTAADGAIVHDAAQLAVGDDVALALARGERRTRRSPGVEPVCGSASAARTPAACAGLVSMRRAARAAGHASSGSGSSIRGAAPGSAAAPAPALRGDPRRRRDHVGVLRAVAQRVVHQHDREHRFGDRRRADADARVVPAVRVDDDRTARPCRSSGGRAGWTTSASPRA